MHVIFQENKISINDNFTSLGRIKIISQEQFVPLYVALLHPHSSSWDRGTFHIGQANRNDDRMQTEVNLSLSARQNLSRYYHTFGASASVDYKERLVKDITKDLVDYLGAPVVSEYSLFFNTEENNNPVSTTDAVRTFIGGYIEDRVIYECSTEYVQFGLYCTTQSKSFSTLQSALYASNSIRLMDETIFNPQLLVLVKAKHLSSIRARLLLGLPLTGIPISDINLMRTTTASNSFTGKGILHSIKDLIREQQIPVYYASPERIREYLIPKTDTNRTIEETIKAALVIAEQNEPIAV